MKENEYNTVLILRTFARDFAPWSLISLLERSNLVKIYIKYINEYVW